MNQVARDIVVTGRVQGVGYRPFVYVTAQELGLHGSVLNGSGKVFIHAEGVAEAIDRLEHALIHQAPPLAQPNLASSVDATVEGANRFEIRASDAATEPEIHVPPDRFTCEHCIAELTGEDERRFNYPFINCTQCGPRYTIITAMPYDRPNTSMASFPLCDACRAEYESPLDRRFHAQPLACPECGPRLEFISCPQLRAAEKNAEEVSPGQQVPWRHSNKHTRRPLAVDQTLQESDALDRAVQALRAGQIVAIKGVGGYHLVCDAADDQAVFGLRRRKRRPDKPLAVMFPILGADGLDSMRESLELDAAAKQAITDPARTIVLARRRADCKLSQWLAPGLNELGVFLPYSPLHHLLLSAFRGPVVATSGNVSGEPVITDNEEAARRLGKIADAFLHHDRPIVRPADDPVVRIMAGEARAIRLGRGIAPVERELTEAMPGPTLAVGGHMKVTVALAWDRRVAVSPHIGDLDSPRSNEVFQQVIEDLQNLYDIRAERLVCDMHPGYASSRWARAQAEKHGYELSVVQHHAAHASSLAGEHPDVGRWLTFTWDGVGYGSDGTLWGGEALLGCPGHWRRVASFRPFCLTGGDRAGREPWRSAAALMWAEGRDWEPGEGPAVAKESGQFVSGRLRPTRPPHSVIPDSRGDIWNPDSLPIAVRNKHNLNAQVARERAPTHNELLLAHEAWKRGLNTFETSAVGRLFDAAASLVLGRHWAGFEGQGPMELEHLAQDSEPGAVVMLSMARDDLGVLRTDWAPLLNLLCDERILSAERADIFHQSIAQALADQAVALRHTLNYDAVGLSGGVFQNRLLTERVIERLTALGIDTRLHRELPANDGGLSFGQIIESQTIQ